MKEKVEGVKRHLKENRKEYIIGGVCLVVGAAGAVLTLASTDVVNARQLQVLTWKSKQVLHVHVEALGDPGNIIQDTTTGIIYASQGQAARELGVFPARISEHLTGKLPHVKNHKFKILGKAQASE
jgi:hypothetical protein